MQYFPFILLFIALLFLITRPFTVLIHELGHAIPSILMTRKKVSIYIGSYGDPSQSLHFNIGLLDIWFRYNPFSWRGGLCVHSEKNISVNKQIIYTLTGPLASFIIASIACYFTFENDLHGFLKLILIIFLGSAILDLFANLTPLKTPIKLFDGRVIYNDGYQLVRLFYYKRFPKEYNLSAELYNQQKFKEAAIKYNEMLDNGLKNQEIFRLAISSYIQVKNYEKAKELIDEFILQDDLNSDDYANAGFLYSQLEQQDNALELYNKSLLLNPDNKYSLNNKGFIFNIHCKFEEAITLFDKAIEIDKTFAHSYNNRGLAKIKIGLEKEGLEDINYSLVLDSNNSYSYRNLGIYHLDKGEYTIALDFFKKAKELDSNTQMIDKLIVKAERHEQY